MDTVVNMEGNVICQDDGTWTYLWSWTYVGSEILNDVQEAARAWCG